MKVSVKAGQFGFKELSVEKLNGLNESPNVASLDLQDGEQAVVFVQVEDSERIVGDNKSLPITIAVREIFAGKDSSYDDVKPLFFHEYFGGCGNPKCKTCAPEIPEGFEFASIFEYVANGFPIQYTAISNEGEKMVVTIYELMQRKIEALESRLISKSFAKTISEMVNDGVNDGELRANPFSKNNKIIS